MSKPKCRTCKRDERGKVIPCERCERRYEENMARLLEPTGLAPETAKQHRAYAKEVIG